VLSDYVVILRIQKIAAGLGLELLAQCSQA